MEYENKLREEGIYTELEIQEKLEDKQILDYKINFALDTIPECLDNKDKIIYKLINGMANDKNSSTFREEITIHQCGYINSPGKLGEDGFVPVTNRPIEVKPQNATAKKLGGNGQFTDFTHSRIEKYKGNNILMVVSGFYNGKLKFIVEFDFISEKFIEHIKSKVSKSLPNGDEPSKYCRNAGFGWNQWKDADNLRLLYLSNNIDKKMFTAPLLKFIHSLEKT